MSVLTLPSRRLGGGSPPGRRQHTHRNWNSEPKEFTKKEKQARRPAHGGSKLVEDAVATMGYRRVGNSLLAHSLPPCTPHHRPLVQSTPKSTWVGPHMAHDAPHPPPAPTQILRGNLSLPVGAPHSHCCIRYHELHWIYVAAKDSHSCTGQRCIG